MKNKKGKVKKWQEKTYYFSQFFFCLSYFTYVHTWQGEGGIIESEKRKEDVDACLKC